MQDRRLDDISTLSSAAERGAERPRRRQTGNRRGIQRGRKSRIGAAISALGSGASATAAGSGSERRGRAGDFPCPNREPLAPSAACRSPSQPKPGRSKHHAFPYDGRRRSRDREAETHHHPFRRLGNAPYAPYRHGLQARNLVICSGHRPRGQSEARWGWYRSRCRPPRLSRCLRPSKAPLVASRCSAFAASSRQRIPNHAWSPRVLHIIPANLAMGGSIITIMRIGSLICQPGPPR
jgi:hypothetical protein